MYKERAFITKAVTDLICLIVDEIDDDGHINPPIKEIHIVDDQASMLSKDSPATHWAVYAVMEGGNTFKYAIYINKETGEMETDGF